MEKITTRRVSLENECHADSEGSYRLQTISGALLNANMQLNYFQKKVIKGWRGQSHTHVLK